MSDTSTGQNLMAYSTSLPEVSQLDEIRNQVIGLIEEATGRKQVILAHTLIVDFFERDHNAAILFNQILYWSSRTTNPDGWFYKTYAHWYEEIRFSAYQVWRIVRGDTRVQKFKRTLWSIGLETEVRMAPNGRNAVHYRLNIPAFMTAFTEWLKDKYSFNTDKASFSEQHLANQPRYNIFYRYRQQLGEATPRERRTIWRYQQVIGVKNIQQSIEAVSTWAQNWSDVIAILSEQISQTQNGTVVPLSTTQAETQNGTVVPLTPETEHSNVPDTAKDIWQQIIATLKRHMRSDYDRLLFQHQLVDYTSDSGSSFTVAVLDEHQERLLTGRWTKFITQYAKDVIGTDVEITFIAKHIWQMKQIE